MRKSQPVYVYVWVTIILCFERDYRNQLRLGWFYGGIFFLFLFLCLSIFPSVIWICRFYRGSAMNKKKYIGIEEISTKFSDTGFLKHINIEPCKWFFAAFFSISMFFSFKFCLYSYLLVGMCTWCFYICRSKWFRLSRSYARTFLQWEHKNVYGDSKYLFVWLNIRFKSALSMWESL